MLRMNDPAPEAVPPLNSGEALVVSAVAAGAEEPAQLMVIRSPVSARLDLHQPARIGGRPLGN